MRRISRAKMIVRLAVDFVGIVGIASIQAGDVRAQERVELSLPPTWIPFTAEYYSEATGHTPQSGMYYRSGDGSISAVMKSPKGDFITIYNVKTKQMYVRFGEKGWVSSPIPNSALQPPRTQFVSRADRFKKVTERVAGLEVWELVSIGPIQHVSRKVPGLNNFTVLMSHPNGLTEYRSIRIGEPPGELFFPPSDADVRVLDGPPRHPEFQHHSP